MTLLRDVFQLKEAPVTANATNLSSSKSEPSRPRPKPKAKPRSAAKSAPSGSTASVDAVVQPGSASHADIDTLVANKINSVEVSGTENCCRGKANHYHKAIITTLNLTESLKVLSAVGKDMARSSRRAVGTAVSYIANVWPTDDDDWQSMEHCASSTKTTKHKCSRLHAPSTG